MWTDRERSAERARFHMLRQQQQKRGDQPYYCLSDFVAPVSSGVTDSIGGFAVTAGIGAFELSATHREALDDYSAIMVKALADRLAEAFAEYMHARARRDWGFGLDENLSNEDLIDERYRGIRPALGYPACPDHTEKRTLWSLLDADPVGVHLTDHFAMTPGASVSGIYLAHPDARYFHVGRLGRDQAEDYARRKGVPLAYVERWLHASLGYDPEAR